MDRSPTLASSSMSGLGRLGGPEPLVCRRLTAFECAANTIDASAIGVTAQSGGHIKGPYIDVVGCGECSMICSVSWSYVFYPSVSSPAGAGRSASSLLLGGFCARGAGGGNLRLRDNGLRNLGLLRGSRGTHQGLEGAESPSH